MVLVGVRIDARPIVLEDRVFLAPHPVNRVFWNGTHPAAQGIEPQTSSHNRNSSLIIRPITKRILK